MQPKTKLEKLYKTKELGGKKKHFAQKCHDQNHSTEQTRNRSSIVNPTMFFRDKCDRTAKGGSLGGNWLKTGYGLQEKVFACRF